MTRIAVIPGDGIGPEVISEGIKVLEYFNLNNKLGYKFDYFDLGAKRYLKSGELVPDSVLRKLEGYDAIFLGAVGDPAVAPGVLERGILLKLRFYFEQYINLRPVRLYHQRFSPLKNKGVEEINFTVIRENTEGLYAGVGGFFKKGTTDEVATQEMVATRKGVDRILKYAFDYARENDGKLTLCDKSNVLTYAHDLWQRAFQTMKGDYVDVQTDHFLIDAITMKMVRNPEIFDVIVTCNMFGDIITDLGAELQGGMGLAVSGNLNPDSVSMFEPVHGSAPDIAGQNIANPLATILAAAMIMNYFGHSQQAELIEEAVKVALAENQVTPDIGGELSTAETGDSIINILQGLEDDEK